MARPRKPYDQLAFQRPNSRHKGRAGDTSIRILQPVEHVAHCAICDDPESDESPLGFGPTGYGICPGCVSGGVTYFASIGWDSVPDAIREQIIAEYLEDQAQLSICE